MITLHDKIKEFYDHIEEDRAQYFEGCLLLLDDDEANIPYKNIGDDRLRHLLVWCQQEELPEFVAYALYYAGEDIETILLCQLEEQRELDREATEDYYERQREYREIQGWKS